MMASFENTDLKTDMVLTLHNFTLKGSHTKGLRENTINSALVMPQFQRKR